MGSKMVVLMMPILLCAKKSQLSGILNKGKSTHTWPVRVSLCVYEVKNTCHYEKKKRTREP